MDWGNNKIPESFPDNVLKVREGYNENLGLSKYVMHENYRKTDSEELYYFVLTQSTRVTTKNAVRKKLVKFLHQTTRLLRWRC